MMEIYTNMNRFLAIACSLTVCPVGFAAYFSVKLMLVRYCSDLPVKKG